MSVSKSSTNSGVKLGYLTAFVLLLLSYVITLLANRQLLKRAEMVEHTNQVLANLELLLSNVKDAETGYRGYLASKNQVYLETYYNSRQKVDSFYNLLNKETADNTLQQQRLSIAYKLINSKYQHIQAGLQIFANHGYEISDSLRQDLLESKQVMDSVRYTLMGMRIEESRVAAERGENVDATARALSIIMIVSLAIAFLMLAFGLITYTKENRARRQADRKVNESQQQLEMRIEELDKANKELLKMRSLEKFTASGRMARTIAHEIRNPLTNINLALEQLRNDWPDINEDIKQLFEMVERNSSRINQLISELLSSTKFAELNYNKVFVNELLDGALDMAHDRILLKNVSVEKRYSNILNEIPVDKEKIKIAFLNLIVNAIEAMEPGKGKLIVSTKAENNKCVIEISDNGSGIDKDSMAKLFEPYFTNKPKGNGLGLTNTQNIILNHRGSISVDSEEGKGTRFRIELDFVSVS